MTVQRTLRSIGRVVVRSIVFWAVSESSLYSWVFFGVVVRRAQSGWRKRAGEGGALIVLKKM
jgi:hypothetical protein